MIRKNKGAQMTQEKEFTLSVHSSKVKSQSTNDGITNLTLDLSDGWGHVCTLFLDAALRVAGKQELRGQLEDLLMAETPCFQIARIEEPPQQKVLVYVEGGVVQDSITSHPGIEVEVFDVDNLEQEGLGSGEIETLYAEKLAELRGSSLVVSEVPLLKITPEMMAEWPRDEWKQDVASGDTSLGYEDWVAHNVESENNPIGQLWWIADDEADEKKMIADLVAKGCTILKVQEYEGMKQRDIIFSLPKAKASEMLGYQVEHEEWLVGWVDENPQPSKPSSPLPS